MEEYTIFSFKAFFIYKHLIKEWLLLLYGFEIWGHENNEIMERIQLEFWKLQLELKYSTPVMSSKIWLLSKCDKERILKKICRMVAKKKMIKRWVTTPYHIFIYLCLFFLFISWRLHQILERSTSLCLSWFPDTEKIWSIGKWKNGFQLRNEQLFRIFAVCNEGENA